MTTMTFAGMPDEGLAFLEDREERNNKEFFDANRALFKELPLLCEYLLAVFRIQDAVVELQRRG